MRTAPEGAALWTPAPRRGGVLCGQHQRDSSLWTPLHRLRAGRGDIFCPQRASLPTAYK